MEKALIPRNISLDLSDWQKLDREAKAQKTSRSDLVRRAVNQFLNSKTKKSDELQPTSN